MPKLAAAKMVLRGLFAVDLDGELVVKVVLLILMLPIAILVLLFAAPTAMIESIPLARPSQVQFYIDAAEEINEQYELSVDWEEVLALDTVLLEQDFSLSSRERADELVGYFWEEYEEEYTYTVEVETTVDVETIVTCEETGEETVVVVEETVIVEEERVGTRTVYKEISLDSVISLHGLTDRQTEKVFRLLSTGLSRFRDVGYEMPEGWEPVPDMFAWPIPDSFRITSLFGPRICPVESIDGFHRGVDVGAPRGTEVIAAEAGVVRLAGWAGLAGRAIIIDHGGGYETRYYHLHSIFVQVGQEVETGDVIGGVGSTGRSTGNHLHFEIRKFGRPKNPLDFFL